MGVAETPVRMRAVEALLQNQQPGEELFHTAAEKACAALEPPTDLHASSEYRRSVAGVLVRRALHTAAEQALQRGEI